MRVIEPRETRNDNTEQRFVEKTYELVENEGWVLQTETEEWREITDVVTQEEWFDVPEEEIEEIEDLEELLEDEPTDEG